MKQMVTSLFGMFGSAVALLFGGWDIALQTLVLFIAFWDNLPGNGSKE